MAKKPSKNQPPKKKPSTKEPEALRPPYKGVKVDFSTQRFCPKCGKLFDIKRKNCAFCNANLERIDPIGDKDKALKVIALTALKNSDPKLRKEAVDDLGDFEELQVLGVLTHVLLNDPDEKVRKEAADEIGDIHHEYSIEALTKALKDPSEKVRKEALEGLTKIRTALQKKKVPVKEKKKAPVRKAELPLKRPAKKQEVSGSLTIGERIKGGVPWIFGSKLRIPKIDFPTLRRKRVSMPIPSKSVGLIVIFIALFVLQTGIVYLIYKTPPALGANSAGDAMFLYPSIHDSFIIEGIVASILIFISSMGYIMLYQASKYVYNRKMALRILVFGVVLIFISYVLLQYMIAVKTGVLSQF